MNILDEETGALVVEQVEEIPIIDSWKSPSLGVCPRCGAFMTKNENGQESGRFIKYSCPRDKGRCDFKFKIFNG